VNRVPAGAESIHSSDPVSTARFIIYGTYLIVYGYFAGRKEGKEGKTGLVMNGMNCFNRLISLDLRTSDIIKFPACVTETRQPADRHSHGIKDERRKALLLAYPRTRSNLARESYVQFSHLPTSHSPPSTHHVAETRQQNIKPTNHPSTPAPPPPLQHPSIYPSNPPPTPSSPYSLYSLHSPSPLS
jgi:hypothetical protein